MPVGPEDFKTALSRWASGVTVVTVRFPGGVHGITVSSFCSLSLEPPLVLICIDRAARAHAYLEEAGCFGVNLLRAGQEDVSNRAAGFHGEEGNRLDDLEPRAAVTGAPLLADCLGWLDCSLQQAYAGGDHTIFVGRVEACGGQSDGPLLWYDRGYRRLADDS